MKRRGWNLRRGQADGDRGRQLGGQVRMATLGSEPVDDSGRSHAQYWAQLGWMRLVARVGRKEAGRIQGQRGALAFTKERWSYSRYLGEMRRMAREGL